jgi:hypothetical protein
MVIPNRSRRQIVPGGQGFRAFHTADGFGINGSFTHALRVGFARARAANGWWNIYD